MKKIRELHIQGLIIFLAGLTACKDNSNHTIKSKVLPVGSDTNSDNALPASGRDAEIVESEKSEEESPKATSKDELTKTEVSQNSDPLSLVASLLGNWSTSCNTAPESMPGFYIKSSLGVSGTSLVSTSVTFTTSDCKDTSKVDQMVSTSGLGLAGLDGNMIKVDLKLTKVENTAYSEEALLKLKITHPNATLGTASEVAVQATTIYDLAGVQNGKLCLGDKSGEKTGATSELRPTTLSDVQLCYSKQ